jgi:hypothetical protein
MSVFNGEHFLREAVESILDQRFTEFEFIAVDDGSTDGSASILDSYQKSDARLKVYHPGHAGLSESLNRGCQLARGKYIARMDADDVACKDRLIQQVDFMEAHPEIGVLGGAVEWIDATGKSLGIHRHPTEDREIKAALLDHCALWHPTVLFRREVFASTGGYRGVTVEASDYDLWLRIADHFQLANLDAVVLKYRIHPFQVSMRKNLQQTLYILAAQVAASFRRSGRPDPLNGVEEITPELLAGWGVTKARQQCELTSNRDRWIRHMCIAGEYSVALDAALETLQSDLGYVGRRQIADLQLLVAQLYWKQGRFLKSLLTACHAVITRPLILGRPLRFVLGR